MSKKKNENKIGIPKFLLWQTSSVSVALSALVLMYVTVYCTDALGLEPVIVGAVFAVSKILDAFTDLLAGFIIDRTNTRWGKGRPYEIFTLFLWLTTWLLFSCPTNVANFIKYVWVFVMYVLMNAVCTTFLNLLWGSQQSARQQERPALPGNLYQARRGSDKESIPCTGHCRI